MSGPAKQYGKGTSLGIVTLAYVIAIAVFVGVYALFDSAIVGVIAGDLAATLVIYAAGTLLDNGSLYDPYWSVIPPVVAVLWWLDAPDLVDEGRTVFVIAVVFIWAIRLTSNWARDWPGLHHEDWRYLDLYEGKNKHVIRFSGVMLFPTAIVLVGMIPLWPSLHESTKELNVIDLVALVVGLAAAAIEYVADEQMRRFARSKQPGEIMTTGLWRYSRHPNYFGEILFWVSLWLFALASGLGWWWTAVGPVAMVAMFLGASIPMLDTRSRARRPAFDDYANRTSALLPLPPRNR